MVRALLDPTERRDVRPPVDVVSIPPRAHVGSRAGAASFAGDAAAGPIVMARDRSKVVALPAKRLDRAGTKVEPRYDVLAVEGTGHFLATGAREENFMGVIVDPDEMIEHLKAGVPVGTLIHRPELCEGIPWNRHRA